jgi:hypothetical protein
LQIRFPASIVIFVGSYLPLALILLVQDLNFGLLRSAFCWRIWSRGSACEIPLLHPSLSLCVLGVCGVCFLLSLVALRLLRPKKKINVAETKYIPAELMSYTLPYVVSFMSIGYQETGKFMGLGIFLVWMFWIIHRSGQMLLNPLLVVFGWRLYEIKYSYPGEQIARQGRALVKGDLEPDFTYSYAAVQSILVIRPEPNT